MNSPEQLELVIALCKSITLDIRNDVASEFAAICDCASCTESRNEIAAEAIAKKAAVAEAMLNLREYILANDPQIQLIRAVGDLKKKIMNVNETQTPKW